MWQQSFVNNMSSPDAYAFALKRIGKLYSTKQHLVIVQNNHIAGTGLVSVNDGFIHKEFRR
ncbi:hypothetical protein [Pectobacterium cacticida]|uniref:hypothetical protein n=1 Tax=Pectobacterium cacticida TaxID=69221 RepID=UPI0039881D81